MAKINSNNQVEWQEDDFGGVRIFIFGKKIDIKAPYQQFFKLSYLHHDLDYQMWKKGNNAHTRKTIDRELLKSMIKTCRIYKKYHRIPVAIVLYSIVRLLGWIWWNDKSNSL